MKLKCGSIALWILLSGEGVIAANAEPLFDPAKRVVLPSDAATTILKSYMPDGSWTTSEWEISPERLDALEVRLASGLAKRGFGKMSFKTQNFYRQYMPARRNGLHLIVANGFYQSASDLFPDKGIDPSQWKHDLLTVFGGGCGFWRAIYIVEQDKLLPLQAYGGRRSTVICNAPK